MVELVIRHQGTKKLGWEQKFKRKEMTIMEDVILIIIRAMAVLGDKGIDSLLDSVNNAVIKSPNKIDNELFKIVLDSIKSYEPKNV